MVEEEWSPALLAGEPNAAAEIGEEVAVEWRRLGEEGAKPAGIAEKRRRGIIVLEGSSCNDARWFGRGPPWYSACRLARRLCSRFCWSRSNLAEPKTGRASGEKARGGKSRGSSVGVVRGSGGGVAGTVGG